MAREHYPIIFTMFAIVIVSLIIVGIASYYGEGDWTWIAQSNASLVLILMVFSVAVITLFGWMKSRR
jgi:membrane protein YdbS with pleckstrin-like domain